MGHIGTPLAPLIDCPSHKFTSRWRGPLIVKEAINDHIYRVSIQPGRNEIINISNLKHYKTIEFSVVPDAASSNMILQQNLLSL